MTTTIKICLVSSFNQFDGYGKHALDIACALKSYGLDVYIHGMYISADPNIRPLDYGLKVANPAGDYFDTMVLFSPLMTGKSPVIVDRHELANDPDMAMFAEIDNWEEE